MTGRPPATHPTLTSLLPLRHPLPYCGISVTGFSICLQMCFPQKLRLSPLRPLFPSCKAPSHPMCFHGLPLMPTPVFPILPRALAPHQYFHPADSQAPPSMSDRAGGLLPLPTTAPGEVTLAHPHQGQWHHLPQLGLRLCLCCRPRDSSLPSNWSALGQVLFRLSDTTYPQSTHVCMHQHTYTPHPRSALAWSILSSALGQILSTLSLRYIIRLPSPGYSRLLWKAC